MSDTVDLEREWEPYHKLLPTAEMAHLIRRPVEFANEPVTAVVPSIGLLSDGPQVLSIAFFTWNAMAEVTVRDNMFKFVATRHITSMQWLIKPVEVKKADKSVEIYTLARLEIFNVNSMALQLNYVGSDETFTHWSSRVRSCLPLEYVFRR